MHGSKTQGFEDNDVQNLNIPCRLDVIDYDSIYYLSYFKKLNHCLDQLKMRVNRPLELADENDTDTIPQPFIPDQSADAIRNSANYHLISHDSTLRDLALNFDDNLNIPIINQNIKNDIYRLRRGGNRELEKYVSLILLRIYKSQLRCCAQCYDLGAFYRSSDSLFYPVQYEYYRFSGDRKRELFMPDAVYDWLKTQQDLWSDSLLSVEIKIIDRLRSND